MSQKIYKAKQIRDWDAFTIKNEPIRSIDLMERAARKCVDEVIENNRFKTVSIFCGVGNNGGDGLVMARLFNLLNVKVDLYVLEFTPTYSSDFQLNLDRLPSDVKPLFIKDISGFKNELKSDVIIDAIFGSGLNKEIELPWLVEIINRINESKSKVIAIDFPSGLFCFDNKMNTLKCAIEADETLTFQFPKMPFFFSRYERYVGHFKILDIGLHKDYNVNSKYEFIELDDIELLIKSKFSHKGTNGHLLLVGGFGKMYGAITLSAKSAYKSGSGYVYVKMNSEGHEVLLKHVLESVLVDDINLIKHKLKAIAIGPGLGKSQEVKEDLIIAFNLNLPMVIDADAINLIAEDSVLLNCIPENAILTPHVKELERLIGKSDSEEEFLEKQLEFSIKHKVFVIQKGAYSKLTCPDDKVYINSTGNEGMAVAGMGDVLTGIIGSLLAQGYSSLQAAQYGMLIHGRAGDLLKKENGNIGFLPTELINILPKVFKDL